MAAGTRRGRPLVSWVLTLRTFDLIGNLCTHLICSYTFPTKTNSALWPCRATRASVTLWVGGVVGGGGGYGPHFPCNDSEWMTVNLSEGQHGLSQLAHMQSSLAVFTYDMKLLTPGDPGPLGSSLLLISFTLRPPAQQKALHFHFNYSRGW